MKYCGLVVDYNSFTPGYQAFVKFWMMEHDPGGRIYNDEVPRDLEYITYLQTKNRIKFYDRDHFYGPNQTDNPEAVS